MFPTATLEPLRTRIADGWAFLLVAKGNPSDTDDPSVQLEPSLLVVTCERLKSLFLLELGLN
ncbi:MAG TPA: hypothetical protein VMR33_06720, partial [Candidatus Baltobacteraceae bacterium]|nr:hypothetical protein [Candidatus Baltobacteraceae bacterium]